MIRRLLLAAVLAGSLVAAALFTATAGTTISGPIDFENGFSITGNQVSILPLIMMHTPANTCGAVPYATDPSANAAPAINTCVAQSITNNWDLYIEQDYRCLTQCNLFQDGANIRFVNGARLIQGATLSTAVVMQADFGTPVSHVTIWGNLYVQGDATHVLGGNAVQFNCNDCYIESIVVENYGNLANGGRALLFAGDRTVIDHIHCYNPYDWAAVGGVRYIGGSDSRAHVDYCESGDDTCQLVPTASGVWTNKDIIRFVYEGCAGNSSYARMLAVLLSTGAPIGTVASSNVIKDFVFIAPQGGAARTRGILFANNNSSGGIIGGKIYGATIDESGNYGNTEAVLIKSGGPDVPIADTSFYGLRVLNPFKQCFTILGPVKQTTVYDGVCGRPHLGRLDALTGSAAKGATTVAVTAGTCALIKNGHTVGVLLDNVTANGSYAGTVQVTTASGDCSGTTLTLAAALLGSATSAVSYVWDYSIQPIIMDTAVSSGNTVTYKSVAQFVAGDNYTLVYDDATTLNTTISSINVGIAATGSLVLAAPITKLASVGNWSADTTRSGITNVVSISGAQGGSLTDFTAVGGGDDVVLFGGSSDPTFFVQDFSLVRPRILDVSPGHYGIKPAFCDHCLTDGGAVFPTAGSTTSNAARQTANVPSYATTLSGDITNVATTLVVADATAFPYRHAFAIKIDSEDMLVSGGFGTTTLTITRAIYNTTAAAHTSGAAITVDQASTTDSMVNGLDVGSLGAGFGTLIGGVGCSQFFLYAPGQGNWIRNLGGCNWQTSTLNATTTWPYTDIAEIVGITGSATTLATVTPPSPPARYDHFFKFVNVSGNVQSLAGSTLHVPSGMGTTIALGQREAVAYRFSAEKQQVFPVSAPSGMFGSREITTGTTDTADNTDYLINWGSASAGAKAQSIPACTVFLIGKQFVISDVQGTAAADNIVITPVSGTINGAATNTISTNRGSVSLQCYAATTWFAK